MDELIRRSELRKAEWEIVRRDEKSMLTSLGEVHFEKTLFKNKKTDECCYLVDRVMGFETNARMTEDAVAGILAEAVQTSYRRGGEAASLTDSVSKQTVKNLHHELNFPGFEKPDEKKKVEYIYIDADEDHVALQYRNVKGDLFMFLMSSTSTHILPR